MGLPGSIVDEVRHMIGHLVAFRRRGGLSYPRLRHCEGRTSSTIAPRGLYLFGVSEMLTCSVSSREQEEEEVEEEKDEEEEEEERS